MSAWTLPAWWGHGLAAGLTLSLILAYQVWLARQLWHSPATPDDGASTGTQAGATSHTHRRLRSAWLAAVSSHPGSEILAIQTLRNAVMTATITASTAALGLMGTLTLAAMPISAELNRQGTGHSSELTTSLVMALSLLLLLFSSLIASMLAVRWFNLVGFVAGMPVGSAARQQWQHHGDHALQRAGCWYGWSWRQLVLLAPVLAHMLHPWAGPVCALAVVSVMLLVDRGLGRINAPAEG